MPERPLPTTGGPGERAFASHALSSTAGEVAWGGGGELYETIKITDSYVKSGNDPLYVNGGDPAPAGTYSIEIQTDDHRYTKWGGGQSGTTCYNDENYDKYYLYGPCARFHIQADGGTTQFDFPDVFTTKDLVIDDSYGHGTFTHGGGTLAIAQDSDSHYDDNNFDATVTIQTPAVAAQQ